MGVPDRSEVRQRTHEDAPGPASRALRSAHAQECSSSVEPHASLPSSRQTSPCTPPARHTRAHPVHGSPSTPPPFIQPSGPGNQARLVPPPPARPAHPVSHGGRGLGPGPLSRLTPSMLRPPPPDDRELPSLPSHAHACRRTVCRFSPKAVMQLPSQMAPPPRSLP